MKDTILLADDDEAVLGMLASHLAESYRVVTASNGIEAVYAYEDNIESIVAVVTDLEMPRLDGAGLTEWVRHINPRMPMILMSGSINDGRILALRQLRWIGFLGKPFLPSKVEELLNNLGVHRRKVELRAQDHFKGLS
jgi:DNA-binding NtrC family response regulator